MIFPDSAHIVEHDLKKQGALFCSWQYTRMELVKCITLQQTNYSMSRTVKAAVHAWCSSYQNHRYTELSQLQVSAISVTTAGQIQARAGQTPKLNIDAQHDHEMSDAADYQWQW